MAVQNQPTSPGAPESGSWATGIAWHSPVVSPGPAGGGQPETPDPVVSPGLSVAHPQADTVSASAEGSVLAAQARYHSHEQDTYGQGSAIGQLMDLPEVPGAHSKHAGGDGGGYVA